MNYIYFFIAILISYTSTSQDTDLTGIPWYLQKVIINGQENFPPNNTEVSRVEAVFYAVVNGDTIDGFDTFVCNNLTGLVMYNTSSDSFIFTEPLEQTFLPCNLEENRIFETFYFDFYFSDQTNLFEYIISTDTGGNKTLVITSASGNQAIYGDQLLFTEDFHSSQFAIHPNPVKNELFLNSKYSGQELNLKIFNLEGKLLSTENLAVAKETSIDVSQLKSGIYFLNIEDENGNTMVKKFLKE